MEDEVIGMLKVNGHQSGAAGIREYENIILSLFGYITYSEPRLKGLRKYLL